MRISGNKLKAMAQSKGISVEQLAQAIERDSLNAGDAVSAVYNWMGNRDHPRARREDIVNLAQALGCKLSDIARFESILKYHRGSPRKAGLIVNLIRGKKIDAALNLLTFTTRRAAVDVKKALTAAIADANSADADLNDLIVTQSTVSAGPTLKRFQQKDRGRAHPILVRMTHITVGLETKTPKVRSPKSVTASKKTAKRTTTSTKVASKTPAKTK